jgi:hypothetical protein
MIMPDTSTIELRRIRISRRMLYTLFLAPALFASISFGLALNLALKSRENRATEPADISQLADRLEESSRQMRSTMEAATAQSRSLIDAATRQQAEMAQVKARYESLKALTTGQEELAKTYRAILQERDPFDQVKDVATTILLGVLASLIAAMLVLLARRMRPPTDQELQAVRKSLGKSS